MMSNGTNRFIGGAVPAGCTIQVHREIIITADFNGLHCWPDAPEHVEYLRRPHRHKFYVRCGINVKHSDRDVEFFTAKQELLRIIEALPPKCALQERLAWTPPEMENPADHTTWNLAMSCEHIAEQLLQAMSPWGAYWVEVWEDQENGAKVIYELVRQH